LGSISSDNIKFVAGLNRAVPNMPYRAINALLVRVISEGSALLTSSISSVLRRCKNILTGSLYIGLAELQLLIHIILNRV